MRLGGAQRAVLNGLIAAMLGLGVLFLLAALGVDLAALGVGSTLAFLVGFCCSGYRSSPSSRRRQQADRRQHPEDPLLLRRGEDDDVR